MGGAVRAAVSYTWRGARRGGGALDEVHARARVVGAVCVCVLWAGPLPGLGIGRDPGLHTD